MQNVEEIIPHFPVSGHIPKRIHQIYITPQLVDEPLPAVLLENISETRALNPNWEYKLWRNAEIEEYILQHYGKTVLQCYNWIDTEYCAIKADLFRYLLIYREGGVYIDLKCVFARPLDDLLRSDDAYILSHWDNRMGGVREDWGNFFPELAHLKKREYLMGVVIAVAGHPFLREVLRGTLKNISGYNPYRINTGYIGTMRVAGPIAYTLSIEKAKKKYPESPFREVRFFAEWGLVNKGYQSSLIVKTDYRKSYKPIIRHPDFIIQAVNTLYFDCLKLYRKYILKK